MFYDLLFVPLFARPCHIGWLAFNCLLFVGAGLLQRQVLQGEWIQPEIVWVSIEALLCIVLKN